MRRELAYLERIVEDFLSFAREQKLNPVPFAARALLEAAAAHLAGEAAARGVRLEVRADDTRLSGDESLLTSALVNLVKNAVQASTAGQVVAVVGRLDGARYLIEVCDAGPGVPEAQQAHIFEPFFTTREQGTGLGLALARKLVEAHRGAVRVRSRPGQTVFGSSFRWPRRIPSAGWSVRKRTTRFRRRFSP